MYGAAGYRCAGVLSKERQPPGSEEELCDRRVSSADVGRERRHRSKLEGTLRQNSEKTIRFFRNKGMRHWVSCHGKVQPAEGRAEQAQTVLSQLANLCSWSAHHAVQCMLSLVQVRQECTDTLGTADGVSSAPHQ